MPPPITPADDPNNTTTTTPPNNKISKKTPEVEITGDDDNDETTSTQKLILAKLEEIQNALKELPKTIEKVVETKIDALLVLSPSLREALHGSSNNTTPNRRNSYDPIDAEYTTEASSRAGGGGGATTPGQKKAGGATTSAAAAVAASKKVVLDPTSWKSFRSNDGKDGERNVPPDWDLPMKVSVESMYQKWHVGDPELGIRPYKYLTTRDVKTSGKRGVKTLGEFKSMMSLLDQEAVRQGFSPEESIRTIADASRIYHQCRGILDQHVPTVTPSGRRRDFNSLSWQSVFTLLPAKSKWKNEAECGPPSSATKAAAPFTDDDDSAGVVAKGTESTMDGAAAAAKSSQDNEKPSAETDDKKLEHGAFFHEIDGKIRHVPEDWTFPKCNLATAYQQWHCGDPSKGIPPLKEITRYDVENIRRPKTYHDFRRLMFRIDEEAEKAGLLPHNTSSTSTTDEGGEADNNNNRKLKLNTSAHNKTKLDNGTVQKIWEQVSDSMEAQISDVTSHGKKRQFDKMTWQTFDTVRRKDAKRRRESEITPGSGSAAGDEAGEEAVKEESMTEDNNGEEEEGGKNDQDDGGGGGDTKMEEENCAEEEKESTKPIEI